MTTNLIKSDWSNSDIDFLTVAELKQVVLVDYGVAHVYPSQLHGLRRDDLRQLAYSIRDQLKGQADAEAARIEEERQSQLHAEVALGTAKLGHEAIAAALREQYDKDKATIAKFQAEVAKADVETNGIVQCIEWGTDDVFLAWERMSAVDGVVQFFEKQAAKQTETVVEIHEWIDNYAKDATSRVLSVNVSQSTNPVYNVRQMQALKAMGWLAKLLTRLHRVYTKIVVEGKTQEADYLNFYL